MSAPSRTLEAAASELEKNFKEVNERGILLSDTKKEVKRLEELQYDAQRRRQDLRSEIDYIVNHYKVCGFLGAYTEPRPVPMILYCPKGHQHIDEGEWAEKPHKTHLCAKCKAEWVPAKFTTVGVRNLP